MAGAAFSLTADELTAAASSPEHLPKLAKALVSRGIARDVAVGWAARAQGRWVVRVGRASALELPAREPFFDLASLTKPMTAFAFARSRLSRTALLGEVLDEARGTASEAVPLELLLAHRAGLEAHLAIYEPLVSGSPIDRSLAFRRVADARRADAVGPLPPEGFAPVYSDLGFALVGEALARTEKARDAGEAIERLVAQPLGRDDLGTARSLSTRWGEDFDVRVRPTEVVPWRGGTVHGAVHDENAWALTGAGGSGHAGMFGTIDAVLAFGCAALDAIERSEGPLAPTDPSRALEWLVRTRAGGTLRAGFDGKSENGSSAGDRAGPRTFGHLGFTGTSLWIDPDADAVVAVLTNRVHPTRDNVSIRAARPVVHDILFAAAAERRGGP